MKTILVIHNHRFGTTTYMFKSKNFSMKKLENQQTIIIKKLGIDFEEDNEEESLDFIVLPKEEVKEIKF